MDDEQVKPKLLLVEDNSDHQKIISRHLSKCDVKLTSRGSIGLEALLRSQFDLIVVDYDLGDMNGIDFVQLVRGQNIHTPILMISSVDRIELEIQAISSGANFFMSKSRLWKNQQMLSKVVFEMMRQFCRRDQNGNYQCDYLESPENRGDFTAGAWIDLLRNTDQSLVILNQNEEIIFWNEKAIEMFGLPQFRGQTLPLDRLMPIESIRDIRKEMASISEKRGRVGNWSGKLTMEFRKDNLKLNIISINGGPGNTYTIFLGTHLIEKKERLTEISDALIV
ncbi:MAG: response regulator [Calditrichaeota bacterium]|nr:response regulator [Calditrichota bacterium]